MSLNGRGNIDWKQVKRSDIDFAFVRISYGLTHEDYTYDENMTNAELAGVPTGTYVYSTALSTTTALKEAQLAISKMQGYKVSIRSYMIWSMQKQVSFLQKQSQRWH